MIRLYLEGLKEQAMRKRFGVIGAFFSCKYADYSYDSTSTRE